MVVDGRNQQTLRPVGYAALLERYDVSAIPNWHRSLVASGGAHRTDSSAQVVEEIYPAKY